MIAESTSKITKIIHNIWYHTYSGNFAGVNLPKMVPEAPEENFTVSYIVTVQAVLAGLLVTLYIFVVAGSCFRDKLCIGRCQTGY